MLRPIPPSRKVPSKQVEAVCRQAADLVVYRPEAHRTPSISAPRNYVYKHVYVYFLAVGKARAGSRVTLK